jgi:aminobenzoyl-glutamate utilization protein B
MSYRLLGTAWPGHFNKALAEAMDKNIKTVGLPTWSDDDQTLARAVQKLVDAPAKDQYGRPIDGLATSLDTLKGPVKFSWGAGSDDIADIAWNVPTVVLRFPSNIPGLPGHSWPNAIAMATPIAHKGVVAGAKVVSSTVLDLLLDPKIIADAWEYHRSVQLKNSKYIPFLENDTKPPVDLNHGIMADYRPVMKKYYYDPSKHETYLEQLGIKYPQLERAGGH